MKPSESVAKLVKAEKEREFDPERGGVAPAREPELPRNHGEVGMAFVQGVALAILIYFGYPELNKVGIVPPAPSETLGVAAISLFAARMAWGLFRAGGEMQGDNDAE